MESGRLEETHIRATQRAPRSCLRCAKRRVRCDKQIPCQECISRGLESTCEREIVKIRGNLIANSFCCSCFRCSLEDKDHRMRPPYHELLAENRRLKLQLLRHPAPPITRVPAPNVVRNITESFERDLFDAIKHPVRVSTVSAEDDIIWPSHECATHLLSFGKTWTSWIHYALHHSTFESECLYFWKHGFHSVDDESSNFLWLSVYFAFLSTVILFIDDEEAIQFYIPQSEVRLHLLNWYDTSLYFLHKGDFLRNHNIRSVQTIAILGIIFNNVGDSSLHSSLWAAAIRIAQSLKMGSDVENPNEDSQQAQVRRRLWWTLVLCEWIPVPYRIPCISEADFDVELPAPLNDDELSELGVESVDDRGERPRPIQYHLCMIQISVIYHRFRTALRLSSGDLREVSELVVRTDESLANLIEQLPRHLQGDEATDDPAFIESEYEDQPWISWQRSNLCLVLFYYRIVINRVLQDQWVQDPIAFSRTRSICLGSARGIISLARAYAGSIARHRPWATSLHIFSAAIILAVEARFHPNEALNDYMDDIGFCISFLERIKNQSMIAFKAVEILQVQVFGLENTT